MSLLADVMAGLRTAIELEGRVKSVAGNVGEMAREMRDIDKRLVRVETVIEIGLSGRGPANSSQGPAQIETTPRSDK